MRFCSKLQKFTITNMSKNSAGGNTDLGRSNCNAMLTERVRVKTGTGTGTNLHTLPVPAGYGYG